MGKKNHKTDGKTSKLTKKEKKKQNHLKLIQGGKDKFSHEKQDWNDKEKKKAA